MKKGTYFVKELSESELNKVNGGIVPLVVWGFWATAAAAGFSGGVTVGLNYKNHHR